jgi:hypothetical protein
MVIETDNVKAHGRKSLLKRNIGDTVVMEKEPKAAAACCEWSPKNILHLVQDYLTFDLIHMKNLE